MKRVTRRATTRSFCWTEMLMLAVGLTACGGDSVDPVEPEVTACTAETGSVTASVDVSGTAPVFAWDPDCAVSSLLVEHSVSVAGGDVWFIDSSVGGPPSGPAPDPTNVISPPITYGTTSLPAGVDPGAGATALVRGRSYTLILFRLVDPAVTTCTDLFTDLCRLGIHEFTW